jgi:glutaredoxin
MMRCRRPWPAILAILAIAGAVLLAAAGRAGAADAPSGPPGVRVDVFWRTGCPHCEREVEFLERARRAGPDFEVRYFEVGDQAANRRLLAAVAERLGAADRVAVPFTVIGERAIVGYLDDASTGAAILDAVRACRAGGCRDVVAEAAVPGTAPTAPVHGAAPPSVPDAVRVPLLGELRLAELSLPAVTVLLAAVDGFNPCAMWVLVFLLGLLVGMKDRRRVWILGGAFVFASALVYFLFLAAWLNLLLFVGLLSWVRLAIGAVAMGGGVYYLREYVVNREAVCKVTAGEQRRRVFERLREVVGRDSLWLALGGIVLLAFAVNLVELVCSAGIPAVYTQVLALNALPPLAYYGYLLLYIIVFMLDDLVIFLIAVKTLQIAGLGGRYAHLSHLLGGVVLLVLGVLLIVRPEWLMWG